MPIAIKPSFNSLKSAQRTRRWANEGNTSSRLEPQATPLATSSNTSSTAIDAFQSVHKAASRRRDHLGLSAAKRLDPEVLGQLVYANALGSRARLLAQFLKAHEQVLSADTLRLIDNQPAVTGGLIGLRIVSEIDLPADVAADPARKEEVLVDLGLLAERMSLATAQTMGIIDPGAPVPKLFNHTAGEAAVKGPWEGAALSPTVTDTRMILREVENELQDPHVQKLIADADQDSWDMTVLTHTWIKSPNLTPSPSKTSARVGKLGMLTRVTNDDELARLRGTLETWCENFKTFGHRDLTFLLSDDSVNPFDESVRKLADSLSIRGVVRFQVLGTEDKERVRQKLKAKVENSPRSIELVNAGLCQPEDVSDMIDGLFGGVQPDGRPRSGPTENRNMSKWVNRAARAFQMDDDNEPFFYTPPFEILKSQRLGTPSTDVAAERVPVDVLQTLEAAKDQPFGLFITGNVDATINQLVPQVPHANQGSVRAYFADDIEELLEVGAIAGIKKDPVFGIRETRKQRVHAIPVYTVEGDQTPKQATTLAPQYAPPVPERHTDLVPWAPAVRDGDLLVGVVANWLGKGREDSSLPISQTRAAGSASAKERVLYDTMISEVVFTMLGELIPDYANTIGVPKTGEEAAKRLALDPLPTPAHHGTFPLGPLGA